MANYLKANIRLQKISERNNKPHYSHLTPQQRAFVKAYEQVQQCERDITRMELYNKNWRKTEVGQEVLGIYFKAIDRKIKLSNRLNLETEAQENELLCSCHTSRFYGGSY